MTSRTRSLVLDEVELQALFERFLVREELDANSENKATFLQNKISGKLGRATLINEDKGEV